MDTKLGKVLTYRERLPLLNPHGLLVTFLAQGHVTIWKVWQPNNQIWQGAEFEKEILGANA